MTLEEFYKATEDMPMDAEITKMFQLKQNNVERIVYDEHHNHIVIC